MADRLGVVLGGGGVLCASELGMLQALAEWGIKTDVVTGCSGGGIIAGALGAGVPLDALVATMRIACARPERYGLVEVEHVVADLLHPTPAPGLFTLRPMLEDIVLHAKAATVGAWAPGYGITTTCLDLGALVRVGSVDWQALSTLNALQATSAFPGLFSGFRDANGRLYQDGGLLDNVPGDYATALGADRLVVMSFDGASSAIPPELYFLDALYRSVSVAIRAAQRPSPSVPTVRMTPSLPPGAWLLGFAQFEALLQAGYSAAGARKNDILRLVDGSAAA